MICVYVPLDRQKVCSSCRETIEIGEVCVQSESFYGRFSHEQCTRAYARACKTVKELE